VWTGLYDVPFFFRTVEPTAYQPGGVQISDGSPATVEPTVDQTGAGQISDGSPAIVEPTVELLQDFHRRSDQHQFDQQ
jgi:hypothetical protein